MVGQKGCRTIPVDLKCRVCGTKVTIQRVVNRLKEPGHIKHTWCIVCRRKTAHVERVS